MNRRAVTIAILCAPLLGGCLAFRGSKKVFVFTEPEGATVTIDGRDTGLTTPAVIEPGSASVTVEKEGFAPQTRVTSGATHFRIPRYYDGGVSDFSIAFPLFWTFDDLIFPFQFTSHEHPRRLYFRLEPVSALDSEPEANP